MSDVFGLRLPQLSVGALRLRADNVQKVKPEYFIFVGQKHYLLLSDTYQFAVAFGCECACKALSKSEYSFWLQYVWCRQCFGYRIALVVSMTCRCYRAFYKKIQPAAGIALVHKSFSFVHDSCLNFVSETICSKSFLLMP